MRARKDDRAQNRMKLEWRSLDEMTYNRAVLSNSSVMASAAIHVM